MTQSIAATSAVPSATISMLLACPPLTTTSLKNVCPPVVSFVVTTEARRWRKAFIPLQEPKVSTVNIRTGTIKGRPVRIVAVDCRTKTPEARQFCVLRTCLHHNQTSVAVAWISIAGNELTSAPYCDRKMAELTLARAQRCIVHGSGDDPHTLSPECADVGIAARLSEEESRVLPRLGHASFPGKHLDQRDQLSGRRSGDGWRTSGTTAAPCSTRHSRRASQRTSLASRKDGCQSYMPSHAVLGASPSTPCPREKTAGSHQKSKKRSSGRHTFTSRVITQEQSTQTP